LAREIAREDGLRQAARAAFLSKCKLKEWGMALTPKEVVVEIAKTGRSVTERALTDWRERRLLPPLTPKRGGPGSGRGKVNVWEQIDIVDRVAFIADHKGWDTSPVIFSLWSCGFGVPEQELRTAWAASVERLSRAIAKQEMDAETVLGEPYFERLEDDLHPTLNQLRKAPLIKPNAISANAYEIYQLAMKLLFAKAVPTDFEEGLSEVAEMIDTFNAARGYPNASSIELLNSRHILRIREMINIFELRTAIRHATTEQFANVQYLWTVICKLVSALVEAKFTHDIGLTNGRIAQANFARVAMPCLLAMVRSGAGVPLLDLAKAVEDYLVQLEVGRRTGRWVGLEGLELFFKTNAPAIDPKITGALHGLRNLFDP
jgi:hypothetical protein